MNTEKELGLFEELENELRTTNNIRTELITTFKGAIINEAVDLATLDSESQEAFMAIARELNSTLNSKDSSNINLVKLKLKDEANKTTSDVTKMVVEFAKTIRLTGGAPMCSTGVADEVTDEEISDVFDASGMEISDGELLEEDSAHD